MQRYCKCSKKEMRDKSFWRRVTPFVVILVVTLLMIVSVNASFPPTLSGENGSILGSTDLDGKVNSLERQGGSIRYLLYYQMYCGSFGSYIPVYVYYDSGNFCNVLCARSEYDFTVEYDPVGDVWNVESEVPLSKWVLTDRGFTRLALLSAGESRANSNVLYVWQGQETDLPGLNLVYNEGYTPGVAVPPSNITATWRAYWEKVHYYEEDVTEAESVGYHNGWTSGYYEGQLAGFEDGRQQGYDEGYELGYDVGFSDGEQTGFDRGYEEGYEDGRGEVSTAPPGSTPDYEQGYQQGYGDGYMIGLKDGYDDGYADGVTDGELNVSYGIVDVGSVMTSIPLGAKQILDGALNFEIFGINVAGTLTAILIVAIVAFVVKWLIGRR